jgi:hypothetical protein
MPPIVVIGPPLLSSRIKKSRQWGLSKAVLFLIMFLSEMLESWIRRFLKHSFLLGHQMSLLLIIQSVIVELLKLIIWKNLTRLNFIYQALCKVKISRQEASKARSFFKRQVAIKIKITWGRTPIIKISKRLVEIFNHVGQRQILPKKVLLNLNPKADKSLKTKTTMLCCNRLWTPMSTWVKWTQTISHWHKVNQQFWHLKTMFNIMEGHRLGWANKRLLTPWRTMLFSDRLIIS